MNLVKRNTSDVAYLVRQGQYEVVEEEGGCRHLVILAIISHSGSSKRRKLILTPTAFLEIPGIQGSEKVPREPDDGEGLTDHSRRWWPPSIRRQT